MKRFKNKNVYKALIALLVILVISGPYYAFKQHEEMKTTPSYSLSLLQTAIEEHDTKTFYKHFDAKNFFALAFDNVIRPIVLPPEVDTYNDFFKDILDSIQQTFISSMETYTNYYIKTGSTSTASKIENQNFAKRFIDLTHIYNLKYQKIESVKIDGKRALITVIAHNKNLDKDFKVQFEMIQLKDKTWKVISFANINSYLNEVQKVVKEKVTILNKPLIKELEKEVTLLSNDYGFHTYNRYGVSHTIFYSPTYKFHSSKTISSLKAKVNFFDKKGTKIFEQSYILSGPFSKNGIKSFSFDWILNPYTKRGQSLIKLKKNDLTVKCQINKLEYQDGSTLALYDDVPGNLDLEDEEF